MAAGQTGGRDAGAVTDAGEAAGADGWRNDAGPTIGGNSTEGSGATLPIAMGTGIGGATESRTGISGIAQSTASHAA